MTSKLHKKVLILIVFLGAVLRFYKLDWGEGYFFHPDEYHIGISANQLSFPDQMNPHFFSYGTFTTYLIYFSKLLLTYLNLIDENLNPILIGRFYSALFSTLTIPLVYLLTKKLVRNEFLPISAAVISAFLPGLIQQAHYTTPESIMIFWSLLALYLILMWLNSGKIKYVILSALSIGVALSVKISSAIFIPPLLLAIFIKNRMNKGVLLNNFSLTLVFAAVTLLTFLIVYPYSVIDWDSFIHSMRYETGVGRGDPLVFYTRQFINTTPVLFQYTKILPFAVDPITLLTGTLGIFASIIVLLKKQAVNQKGLFIVLFSFLLFFIPNSFLFAKWTRFIIPALPFFVIFTTILIDQIKSIKIQYTLCVFALISSAVWMSMFTSIYRNRDVRLQANNWIHANIPMNSVILTEAGNMIEMPIGRNYQKTSFDFYNLDDNPALAGELPILLENSDYFIVQSRRIFANHRRFPDEFPITAKFYDALFTNELGFTKITEFTSYPGIKIFDNGINLKDESAEETWTVFDHPVVRIYEKTENMTAQEYNEILKI